MNFRWAMVGLLTATVATVARSQDTVAVRTERWRFLSPTMSVSDDPRRTPVPTGSVGAKGTLVLRGGRIFDGTGAPAREATLVIHDNHVDRILPPTVTTWPADARVIDVTGQTVLPGLIDLHTHLTYPDPDTPAPIADSRADATLRGVEHLRYYIESGITSVRDVGSQGDVPFRLQEWVARNRVIGPRVFAAGKLITGTGGHGDDGGDYNSTAEGMLRIASGPDDWRNAVREEFAQGADLIKIASHFSPAEVSAAIQEAHALGLKVTCDCETFYTKWAVEAGIDMIEHPLPRTDETIALMARKGTQADPTLIPYIIIFNSAGAYYGTPSRRFTFSKEANFDLVRKLKQAGIKLGIGTDLVRDWFRYLPGPYITELKQFVRLGYTVPEALIAATRTNAELLDMGDRLGTLEPGKLADVTVIAGKPDVSLDDLVNVSLVIRDGYVEIDHGRLNLPRHVPTAMPTGGPGT
jgi:imidazolonepropionase-like amidohydrolase